MKQLPVPSYLQDDGSPDCGPVCVQMVLGYYGLDRDVQDLKKTLAYGANGTSAYENGIILLREGFAVRIVTAQPRLFSPNTIPDLRTQDDIVRVIEDRMALQKEDETQELEKMIRFVKEGGIIQLAIPAFEHIKEAIDAESPVIALMFGKAMGSNEGGYHFVVVSGYEEGRVFITNPSPISQKQAWFPFKDFIYGVHAATTHELDNGTFLIASRKKS